MDSACDNCQKSFTHRADRPQRFCSMTCRRAFSQEDRACPTCGTHFVVKRSATKKYCDPRCAPKSPGRPRDDSKHPLTTCPGCGRDFENPTYKSTEYCSKQCRHDSTQVVTICPGCGEEFSYARSWPRIHCSARCYGARQSKGGKVYYGGNWAVQRARAIGRDGGCVDCGATEVLHVHHVRPLRSFDGDWRAGNDLANLATVCPDHHLARHGGAY